MCSSLKKFILSMFIFMIFSSSIVAIDCKYPDAGLTITYDENNVTVNSEDFKEDYFVNLLPLAKWGSNKYSTNELKIDQTLFKKYGGYACPTNMKVCKYANYSLNLPSLESLGYDLAQIVAAFGNLMGVVSDEDIDEIEKNAWALLSIDERELHILTEKEYNNSDIKNYEGGVVNSEIIDVAEDAYTSCKITDNWFGKILGSVCAIVSIPLEITIDTLIADGVTLLYYRYTDCNTVKYEGEYASFDINCGLLQTNIYKYRYEAGEYKVCGDNSGCKVNYKDSLFKVEDEIKNQCSSILKYYNYNETQKDCMKVCLNIENTLNEYKKGTDLYETSEANGECGLSGNIIKWIKNILKWVKYILPVLVIILGILDFIKAIASNSDDEMKKAQGRFVKRLIAAALLFIIPTLIEFILTVFKIESTFCGVI